MKVDQEDAEKKRTIRACDSCRRRKIKCITSEDAKENQEPCVNCKQSKLECTYDEPVKRRGPPKGYIEGLENRVNTLERLLKSLAPGVDFSFLGDANHPPPPSSRLRKEAPQEDDYVNVEHLNGDIDLLTEIAQKNLDGRSFSDFITKAHNDPQASSSREPIIEENEQVAESQSPSGLARFDDNKFFGRSSGFSLVTSLSTYNSPDKQNFVQRQATATDGWRTINSHATQIMSSAWRDDANTFHMPPKELSDHLIDLYFLKFNSHTPLIHRPSFERDIAAKTWEQSKPFASLFFAILAIGSRFSDDPRVLQDMGYLRSRDPRANIPSELMEQVPESSAGYAFAWASLRQTSPILVGATLYDMQASVLMAYYFTAASAITSGWSAMGFYLRRMIDVGAHRRRNRTWNVDTLHDDLRKRAFWALFVLDRALSAALGRPIAIHDEDIDLDFPLEITDEQLDELNDLKLPYPRERPPTNASEHPVPMHAFNAAIQLAQITGRTLKQLYSISKPPSIMQDGKPPWEQKVVAELDSSLNAWLNRLPPHLKWNPQDLDSPHITQRGLVLAMYYNTQLLVHRDFLSPDRKGILGFPSQMIVINAARSLCQILWNLLQAESVDQIFPYNCLYGLSSAMPLLSNVYAANKVLEITDSALNDVQKCVEVLKATGARCHTIGQAVEGICKLADLDELRRMKNLKRPAPESDSQSGDGSSFAQSPLVESPGVTPKSALLSKTPLPDLVPAKKASKRAKTTQNAPTDLPPALSLPEQQQQQPPMISPVTTMAALTPAYYNSPVAPSAAPLELPFYTTDLASNAFSDDFRPQPLLFDPHQSSNMFEPAPPVRPEDYGSLFEYPAMSPTMYQPNAFQSPGQPAYYAERQPAAALLQQPLANFFDPGLFGSTLQDWTANQTYYR